MSHMTMPPQQPMFVPQPMPPVAPVRKNGLGTTSLVTGIVAGCFAFIPVVGAFFAIPLAIIAIFFGVFGLVRALRGRATMGLPIAGGILGIVAVIISIAFSVSAAKAVDDAINSTDSTGTTTTTTTQDEPAGDNPAAQDKPGKNKPAEHKPAAPAQPGIGDTVTDGKLAFTITNVKTGVKRIGDQYLGEKADGSYTIVSLKVKNVGHESATFDDFSQYVYSAKEDKYSADTEADIYLDDSNAFLNEINPGNTVKGKMAFDMPDGVSAATIELHGGLFSGGATVKLK